MSASITLVLGGARSGKSAWAEREARTGGRPVLFVATATAGDAEMAERIATHQANRPAEWRTVEEPIDLAGAIRTHAHPIDLVIVDCLTLWVSNLIFQIMPGAATNEDIPASTWLRLEDAVLIGTRDALDAARKSGASAVIISNEVGLGVVPPHPLGRNYRDVLGRVNQVVAAEADAVILMVAGLPLRIKASPYQSATLPSDS